MAPPTTAATPARTAFCVTIGPAALVVEEGEPVAEALNPVLEPEPDAVADAAVDMVLAAVPVGVACEPVCVAPGAAESLSTPAVTVTGIMSVL